MDSNLETNWNFGLLDNRELGPTTLEKVARACLERGIEKIYAPKPSLFNGEIVASAYKLEGKPYEFTVEDENGRKSTFKLIRGHPPKMADGLILREGESFGITSADCPLLVVWDESKKITGVAHCGLLSLARGVVRNLVREVEKIGIGASNLKAFITTGAHYLPYEVREGTSLEIKDLLVRTTGLVDEKIPLYELIKSLLIQESVQEEKIGFCILDTITTEIPRDRYAFWSQHRGEKDNQGNPGRNLVIVRN